MTNEIKHTDVTLSFGKKRRAGVVLTAAAAAIVMLLSGVSAAGADTATTKPATATAGYVTDGLGTDGAIKLLPGRSSVLTTKTAYKRVSMAASDVADINTITPTNIIVTGKKPGETQLIVWDDQDHSTVIPVTVDVDLESVKRHLKEAFPGVKVEAAALNDAIALRGPVPSAQAAEQIVEMTAAYGKVHNFLEVAGGQQVILQVQIAEVNKSVERDLGVNFGGTNGVTLFGNNAGSFAPFGFTGGPPVLLGIPSSAGLGSGFVSGAAGDTAFQIFVKALRENNLMRTLAEPNLIAINGQEASFLAGGSIPIPVSQGGTGGAAAISVQQQEYGVKLTFTPTMLGNGKIRLKVNPEVSDLDYGNAITIPGSGPIPGLTTQKVQTVVELGDGQSFALAGLLNHKSNMTVDAIPLLGDIPILGELFRSTKYQRSETELVIIVTPRLVAPMNPDQVPALPGQHWRHPSAVGVYLGMDMGGPAVEKGTGSADKTKAGQPPMYHGTYGFTPAGAGAASAH